MTRSLERLLEVAGSPLCETCEMGRMRELFSGTHAGDRELSELLSSKNGFYAFESALLVRPIGHGLPPLGVAEWNAPGLWKGEYGGTLDGLLCFAEDIFGGQFALSRDAVVSVDPETGDVESVAATLEGWATTVLEDHSFRTGHPLAHDWQARHGPLAEGYRLLPKVPFVTGGKFVLENLYAAVDVEGMRFRGSIARQIRDVPDGGHVTFEAKPRRES